MDNNTIRVSKKCPACGWRLFDKVSPATGVVQIKCPKCRQTVTIDLAYRKTVVCRKASCVA